MNDTCEEGCLTNTQQFMFMGQLLLLSPSASFKSVWISDLPISFFGCEPALHSPHNPFKPCQQKERGSLQV